VPVVPVRIFAMSLLMFMSAHRVSSITTILMPQLLKHFLIHV
jgi:hypothetical protein